MAGHQVPTVLLSLSPQFLSRTVGKIKWKTLRIEMRTERDCSPFTITGETESAWERLNYYQLKLF